MVPKYTIILFLAGILFFALIILLYSTNARENMEPNKQQRSVDEIKKSIANLNDILNKIENQ